LNDCYPLNSVNPLQGTASDRSFSTGNTYPAVGVPRGMTYWTPQTSDSVFIFDRRCPKLSGLRATHSPSPWMGDFGHFDVLPVVGPPGLTPTQRATAFSVRDSTFAPHRFTTRLPRRPIAIDLSATDRAAVIEFTFHGDVGDQAGVVLQAGASPSTAPSSMWVRDGGRTVVGVSRACHGEAVAGFGGWFVAEVSGADVTRSATLTPEGLLRDGESIDDRRAGVYLQLRPHGPVTLRIGTSFISEAQARLNLRREIGDREVDAVAEASARAWDAWLRKAPPAEQVHAEPRRYHSAMYRVGLFPTKMHEPDEHGRPQHFSPYDGRVHPGVLYTNNGFWDTYRTVYPLLGLIDPEGFGQIVEGFLAAYREGGWLPKWASPGYRDCMVGTHLDSVIAEAVAHDIHGFDWAEAYEAIRRHAFEPGDPHGRWGRQGLASYLERGYVDDRTPHSVCRTLDFAYCDWCIAQVARHLGYEADAETLLGRAQNYRHLWHAGVGFMRPRKAAGAWVEPWSEWDWGPAYIEGGPWQHSWTVPHDLDGLAELIGGRDALADKLERLFDTPPRFDIGRYPDEIHEMTEMALARDAAGRDFGQYAHSNQPSHNLLWQLQALGRTGFAQPQIDRVLRDLYTPDDLPGDEDNGEMSAWYLLSVLGRPRPCPGRPAAT
jgi:predicted alpha-1,2-mannosidase